MSEIKVNKITPRAACGTTQLGDSGDTITIPSGATIQNLGTATGFGGTGVVSWDTGSIKTTGFTAVTGTGYFCDTTGGAFTVTLPLSPSAGDVVGVSDYAKTFDTNNLTLGRNGSNIGGSAFDALLSTEGSAVTLVYVDATKGWIVTDSGNQSDASTATYIAATGGCITTCGDFKMHTFTAPGALCVSAVGNPAGSSTVDYLVVAGGGGAGSGYGAGGGGGGFRESPGTASGSYSVSPLGVAPAVALPVSVSPYAITVGGGGTGSTSPPAADGTRGANSIFSTITSTGGGAGGNVGVVPNTGPGGSGGGASVSGGPKGIGTGDTPPTTPAQGNDGGLGYCGNNFRSGGGGGATVAGVASPNGSSGGCGGTGATTSISASPTSYSGGGGGGQYNGLPGGGGASPCGTGKAASLVQGVGPNADNNTGGGGGGGAGNTSPGQNGGNGGSGIVIIRYKFQ